MTKSKWKPLYEYKVPFFTQVGLLLGWVVIIALIGGEAVLIINEMRLTLVLSCMLGAVLFVLALILLYVLYRHSSSAVRRRMQKYGIETFCKQKGLVLARSASQKMGLFTSAGKVVVEPEYRNIVFMSHFYLLEDERGLWGAYNASLSRIDIGASMKPSMLITIRTSLWKRKVSDIRFRPMDHLSIKSMQKQMIWRIKLWGNCRNEIGKGMC